MTDIVFDSSSVFARAWFAVINTPGGSPQQAICAALHTVLSLLRGSDRLDGERPDRILFAWDGRSKRDKGRAPKPLEFYEARELFKTSLTVLLSAAHGYSEIHEADDVVATTVANSTAEMVFVVTGDKDLHQLQGGKVRIYCLNQKMLLSARLICGKWGVKTTESLAIALAILGEKSDAIQGIRGWGPARVKKLFMSATESMNFAETLGVIAAQIPEGPLLDGFYRDLELTLLANDVKGLPEPSKIVVAPMAAAEKLQMPEIMLAYADTLRNYTRRAPRRVFADADGDEEDAPVSSASASAI